MMLLALPGRCTLHIFTAVLLLCPVPGPLLQQLQQCWHQAFKAAPYCDCASSDLSLERCSLEYSL